MNKIKVFWCNATSFAFLGMATDGNISGVEEPFVAGKTIITPGLGGATAYLNGIGNPLGALLDSNIFEFETVIYPAAALGMGPSITEGAANVKAKIDALPSGQKFMLSGMSQGACVMSSIYNELRYGTLTSRNADFIGGFVYGNPRRQQDYRGSVGGTWSGCWDILGSTTGGHGAFPASGPYARLQNCEADRWIEFVYPDDIFAGVGNSTLGINWQTGVAAWLANNPFDFASYLNLANTIPVAAAAFQALGVVATVNKTFTDAIGQTVNWYPTVNGHNTWMMPPIDNPDNGLTQLQIGLKYALAKATEYSVASIITPPATPGWSTTLLAPAA